jgi:hypothetical protein
MSMRYVSGMSWMPTWLNMEVVGHEDGVGVSVAGQGVAFRLAIPLSEPLLRTNAALSDYHRRTFR